MSGKGNKVNAASGEDGDLDLLSISPLPILEELDLNLGQTRPIQKESFGS